MRLRIGGAILLLSALPSAMANIIPIDPHVMLGTGGDATDINLTGDEIFLSNPSGTDTGGGIFVFHNITGMPLAGVDIKIDIPDSFSPFPLFPTIVPPTGSSGQVPTFGLNEIPNSTCFGSSTTDTCLDLSFVLRPGPLVPIGGNFIVDFDAAPGNPTVDGGYQGVDALVFTNSYNGTTDSSTARVGEWPNAAAALITPIPQVPEPRYYAGLLGGLMALAIFARRRLS